MICEDHSNITGALWPSFFKVHIHLQACNLCKTPKVCAQGRTGRICQQWVASACNSGAWLLLNVGVSSVGDEHSSVHENMALDFEDGVLQCQTGAEAFNEPPGKELLLLCWLGVVLWVSPCLVPAADGCFSGNSALLPGHDLVHSSRGRNSIRQKKSDVFAKDFSPNSGPWGSCGLLGRCNSVF